MQPEALYVAQLATKSNNRQVTVEDGQKGGCKRYQPAHDKVLVRAERPTDQQYLLSPRRLELVES